MPEYVPTTDEVRIVYALSGDKRGRYDANAAAEFDRWLSQRDAESSDQALIDLWWRTCNDEWAIPDELMVKSGRAARAWGPVG